MHSVMQAISFRPTRMWIKRVQFSSIYLAGKSSWPAKVHNRRCQCIAPTPQWRISCKQCVANGKSVWIGYVNGGEHTFLRWERPPPGSVSQGRIRDSHAYTKLGCACNCGATATATGSPTHSHNATRRINEKHTIVATINCHTQMRVACVRARRLTASAPWNNVQTNREHHANRRGVSRFVVRVLLRIVVSVRLRNLEFARTY